MAIKAETLNLKTLFCNEMSLLTVNLRNLCSNKQGDP